MTTLVIADFTKCYPNTQTQSLSAVEGFLRQIGLPEKNLVAVVRADQPDLAISLQKKAQLHTVPTMGHAQPLVKDIVERAGRVGHKQIATVSYNGPLLVASQMAGSSAGMLVTTHTFKDLHTGHNPYAESRWPFDSVAPLDEALSILERGLASRRAGSIRKTDIRGLMGQEDERFAFHGNAASTGTLGMVTAILNAAVSCRMVKLDPPQDPNPWVTLVSQAVPSPNVTNVARTVPIIAQPVSDLSLEPPEAFGYSEDERIEVPHPPVKGDIPAADGHDDAMEHRSRVMEQHIRRANMGPYVTLRLACFSAIDELKLSDVPRPLVELIHGAICGAEEKLAEGESTREKVESQPWRRMDSFLHKILTRSGAVLHDGVPLSESLLSRNKKVTGLAEHWRARADAQIVIEVIKAMDDITVYDLPNLAGALYHDRSEKGEQMIIQCLEILIEDGLVKEVSEVDGEQYLRLANS